MLISKLGQVPENTVNETLLSHYDIMPTLLDYLELDNPEADQLPGHSFAGLLRNQDIDEHHHVVVFDEYGPVRMIRNKEWKYIHRYPYGPHELYNLAEDPNERTNLVDNVACVDIKAQLKLELDDWFIKYTDPARDGRLEPVTGRGQLGLVGPEGKGKMNFADEEGLGYSR
ncbi:MAG: sulfatase/phosphatase domain-containing protein, partial [Chloroflexota bacterium]